MNLKVSAVGRVLYGRVWRKKMIHLFFTKKEKQYDGFRDVNYHVSSNSQMFNIIMTVLSTVI